MTIPHHPGLVETTVYRKADITAVLCGHPMEETLSARDLERIDAHSEATYRAVFRAVAAQSDLVVNEDGEDYHEALDGLMIDVLDVICATPLCTGDDWD